MRLIIAFLLGGVFFLLIGIYGKYFILYNVDYLLPLWLVLVVIVVGVFGILYLIRKIVIKYVFNYIDEKFNQVHKDVGMIGEALADGDSQKLKNGLEGLAAEYVNFHSRHRLRRYLISCLNSVFILLGAILGTTFISQQNELIEKQNIRLDQQTYLQEAERRSGLVFLMTNIMDALDQELKEDYLKDGKRNLSPQLIARIISLSQRLLPYVYLEGDEMTKQPYSPERAQLFTNLVKSDIDINSLETILKESNFTYSDFSGVTFSNLHIDGIDFSNSRFQDITFNNSAFSFVEFSNVIMSSVTLDSVFFDYCNFKDSKIDVKQNDLVRFNSPDFNNTIYSNFNSNSYYDTVQFRFELFEGRLTNTYFYGNYDLLKLHRMNLIDFLFKGVAKEIDINGSIFAYENINIDSLFADFHYAKSRGYDFHGSTVDTIKYEYIIVADNSLRNIETIFNKPLQFLEDTFLEYAVKENYNHKKNGYDTISYKIGFNSDITSILQPAFESIIYRDYDMVDGHHYVKQLSDFMSDSDFKILSLIDSLEGINYDEDYHKSYKKLSGRLIPLLSEKEENYSLLKKYVQDLVITNTMELIENGASKNEHIANKLEIKELIDRYIKEDGFYYDLFDDFGDFLDAFEPETRLSIQKRTELKNIYTTE